ncbi:hypothetical protein R80B4_00832 [Fibrobacteres bacterium R8-0-B4]
MTSFVKHFVKYAVALCVLCGIAFAQSQSEKPKAAVYIKGNPPGRDVLRMAVNTFLVKTGMYQMIAVDAIDLLAQEHIRQRSGSVSDNEIARLGRDAGAQYVCVVERTEIDGVSYVTTSMVSVQSKIAEFSDMKELPRGERVINVIERQINAMLEISSGEELEGGYESASESSNNRKPLLPAVTYLRINGQNEAEVSFGSAGGTKTLTVSTDGGGYDITFVPAWCSADKYGTSFSLTCTPNQTSSYRNDWFNVTSGDKTVKVSISQSGSGSDVSSAASAHERRIDVSSSYSYHFTPGKSYFVDSTAPATFKPSNFSDLSLSMGLNVYKGVFAYFDLGINNQTVKRAIDWAGRIGSKYFDLQIEYSFIGGKVSYWNDANIGANKDTPPDLTADYDQTWLTVALMYPFVLRGEKSNDPYGVLLGLFYNYAKVPALIWINKNSDDEENRFAFLDKSCPVTTFGIRFYGREPLKKPQK